MKELIHWSGETLKRDIYEKVAVIQPASLGRRHFIKTIGAIAGSAGLLGLFARKAQGASTILSRTVNSIQDNRIVLANSNFARPFSISSWTTLRVGIRFIMNNNAADITGTPRFSVGLCSGQSNLLMDATTTHWGGVTTDESTWKYFSGGMVTFTDAAVGTMLCRPAKRVGSTLTTGASGMDQFFPPAAGTTSQTRRMHFVDITKGSPNYTFKLFSCNSSTASPDVLVADFLGQMGVSSPSFTNHTYSSGITLAMNEGTDGTFDNINIGWDHATPTIEICDVAVAKLA